MTDIAFSIDHDLAGDIGKRAAQVGQTASSWIASRLPGWLECDTLADELGETIVSLSRTIAEAANQ